jgi:hypothetical protein
MISLLIFVIVLVAIVYCLNMLPIPAPFKQIIWVVIAVILLVWLLEMLPGLNLGHLGRLN